MCSSDLEVTFWLSLAVTFVGAALFSWSRTSRRHHVPQEAIIGITFVVAAAGVILLLSRVSGGKEELEHLLTGDILNVQAEDVGKRVALFVALGLMMVRLLAAARILEVAEFAHYSAALLVSGSFCMVG